VVSSEQVSNISQVRENIEQNRTIDYTYKHLVQRGIPYNGEQQGPTDSQHPTIEDGPEYFSSFWETKMKLSTML
jgi:hypothetical protein